MELEEELTSTRNTARPKNNRVPPSALVLFSCENFFIKGALPLGGCIGQSGGINGDGVQRRRRVMRPVAGKPVVLGHGVVDRTAPALGVGEINANTTAGRHDFAAVVVSVVVAFASLHVAASYQRGIRNEPRINGCRNAKLGWPHKLRCSAHVGAGALGSGPPTQLRSAT